MLQRLMLVATVGLIGAAAIAAEDLLLSPDAARTAAALREAKRRPPR